MHGGYQHGWSSDIDRVAMKNRLQLLAGLHHEGIVLTELGIKSPHMSQLEKARAYCDVMGWLCDPEWPTSARYVLAIPFCGTGSAEWKEAGYVLDDPAVYKLFREFAEE